MNATPAYDLAPSLELLMLGALVAMGPLLWVWLRHRNVPSARRLHVLTVLTLFLTFDLVLFGAFTRLTDSGLGCPDWPGCYGNSNPVQAHAEIAAAQAAMPSGPVTHTKAWIEMIHRYLAMGVGALILTLAFTSWIERKHHQGGVPISPWWPMVTLLWVCVQGAFGALTVTMRLFPAIVTLHLLGGMLLLAMLSMQAVGYSLAQRQLQPVPLADHTRTLMGITYALLWWQLALGGWVSTNYAVLACSEFPRCQGSWWPMMDFHQGFEIWRELGLTREGEHISFQALTAIHYVHRSFALLVLAALALLAWRLHRVAAVRSHGRWLAMLAGAQLLTGLSNIVLQWPLALAVAHTAGAALLVVAMTWSIASTRSATDTVSASRLSASRLSA